MEKLNRLKVVLAEQDKTNRWLSEKMEIGQMTVSRWVTNKSQPSLDKLFKIAHHVEVDVCDLLHRPEGEPETETTEV